MRKILPTAKEISKAVDFHPIDDVRGPAMIAWGKYRDFDASLLQVAIALD